MPGIVAVIGGGYGAAAGWCTSGPPRSTPGGVTLASDVRVSADADADATHRPSRVPSVLAVPAGA